MNLNPFKFGNKQPAMTLQVYKAEIDPSPTSDLEVNFIGLVDRPAIERNFQAFKKQKQKALFSIDTEKKVISGPAMIADMPLYRKDDQFGEYYVVFGAKEIRCIVEKFAAKGYMQNFNLFHEPTAKVTDVTIFNSFVSDKELGISPLKGFEDIADGSWFISAKVNNDAVWQKVKSGEIKGFSVEGLFSYVPVSKLQMSASLPHVALTVEERVALAEQQLGAKLKALFEATEIRHARQREYQTVELQLQAVQQHLERQHKISDGIIDWLEQYIKEEKDMHAKKRTSRGDNLTGNKKENFLKALATETKFEAMGNALAEFRNPNQANKNY